MFRMILIALMIATGCKQKPAEDTGAAPGKSGAMGPAGGMGSAMGTKIMDAAAPSPSPASDAAAAPMTGDDLAKRYEECIRFSNEARWAEWKNCYEPAVMFEAPGLAAPRSLDVEIEQAKQARDEFPDLRQEPQLLLVSGNTVIAMLLVTGTSTKTKKRIAFYLGHVVGTDPTGKRTRDLAFWDAKTVEAQRTGKPGARALAKPLPTKISLISKDDDTEKKHLELVNVLMERELGAIGSALADNVVWSVQHRPEDLTKAQVLGGMETRLEKTDLRYKLDHAWAAGDYVAALETITGTATADSPDKKIKRGDTIQRQLLAVHRFANGKLAQVWVFGQG